MNRIRMLIQLIKALTVRLLQRVGLCSWPTKSYEFWMILQMLLYFSKPRTIVEFGSGRSTHYFAEYALKKEAKFLSVEQNIFYFLRNRVGLQLAFLPGNVISYVRLSGVWYSEKKLQKEMDKREIDTVEFLFIDGPGGITNPFRHKETERDVPQCEAFIQRHASNLQCVIFDDLQRESVKRLFDRTAATYNMERYVITRIEPARVYGFLLPEKSLVATQFPPPLSSLLTRLE